MQNHAQKNFYHGSNIWADQYIQMAPQGRFFACLLFFIDFRADWAHQFHAEQSSSYAPLVEEFQQSKENKESNASLDTSMLRKLQTCSNEKVRNSNFVKFLSRVGSRNFRFEISLITAAYTVGKWRNYPRRNEQYYQRNRSAGTVQSQF